MEAKLKRPKSLIKGNEYLRQENTGLADLPAIQRVTFVSYCPCAALVVFRIKGGKIFRCLRDEIFTLAPIYQDLPLAAPVTSAANLIEE